MHKRFRTFLDIVVFDPTLQGGREVSGHTLFYLTRGDSAAIPADERAREATADSTRWWIDRWGDETIGVAGGGGAHANSGTKTTPWDVLRFDYSRIHGWSLLAQRHP